MLKGQITKTLVRIYFILISVWLLFPAKILNSHRETYACMAWSMLYHPLHIDSGKFDTVPLQQK